MATRTTTPQTTITFTRREWHALGALRARYAQHSDLFSPTELAHLQFIRWLYRNGRLVP
jgi:hypothetical protein